MIEISYDCSGIQIKAPGFMPGWSEEFYEVAESIKALLINVGVPESEIEVTEIL